MEPQLPRYSVIILVIQLSFIVELTKADLAQLHQMPVDYARREGDDENAPCIWLYRNKTKNYFRNCRRRGIMQVYSKDHSGDPASPINGKIDGLFFMASVENGSMCGEAMRTFAFGNTRLQIPIKVLFDMACNMYFANFYCMRCISHQVTLVLARPGSAADRFCKHKNLVPLRWSKRDVSRNPFLFCTGKSNKTFHVGTASNLVVEVLFTEDISMQDIQARGAEMKYNIPTIGRGRSTEGGIPKNPRCAVCNLRN
jgi:hypothetical protein